jgi:uncharacterized protein (DUF362 family)
MEKNEIVIIYGDDIKSMAIRLAEEADLAGLIGDRGKRIGLKPNLVVAQPASTGATTHPEIAEGLISYLKEKGFANLAILEGSWAGCSTIDAYSVCGYRRLADKTGVRLIDTKTDKAKLCDCKGMNIKICESALSIDFMINLPVMKGHCQTLLTCALKNNKGLIPDSEKRHFHSIGLTKPIAHLNTAVRNDFIVVDGICGDPDFEQGGNPVHAGRMAVAHDPVLCDAWACSQMGFALSDVPYIGLAEKLGVGSADVRSAKIRELNEGSASLSEGASPSGKMRKLAAYINADKSCSACYASLIFALSRLGRNEHGNIRDKICVGQGFQGKHGSLGVGQCTSGFKVSCPGCPPSGAEILAFLQSNLHADNS